MICIKCNDDYDAVDYDPDYTEMYPGLCVDCIIDAIFEKYGYNHPLHYCAYFHIVHDNDAYGICHTCEQMSIVCDGLCDDCEAYIDD